MQLKDSNFSKVVLWVLHFHASEAIEAILLTWLNLTELAKCFKFLSYLFIQSYTSKLCYNIWSYSASPSKM